MGAPATIDEYIAECAPEVRPILEKIRAVCREAAPDAEEKISYRMPAFAQNGILIYFAAFKSDIGVYPPVRGDAELEAALAPYRGEKGNLRFPFDQPLTYDLISRIVKLRLGQNAAKRSRRKAQR